MDFIFKCFFGQHCFCFPMCAHFFVVILGFVGDGFILLNDFWSIWNSFACNLKRSVGCRPTFTKKMLYVFFFVYLHPRYCSHGQLGSGAKLKITTCFKNERYGRVCGCSMCVSLCVFARFVIMYITLVQVTVHQRIFDRVEYRKACHILLAIAYGNTIFNKLSNNIYYFFFILRTYMHRYMYLWSRFRSPTRIWIDAVIWLRLEVRYRHTYILYIYTSCFRRAYGSQNSLHAKNSVILQIYTIFLFVWPDFISSTLSSRYFVCVFIFWVSVSIFLFDSFFYLSLSLVRSLYLSLCVLFTVYSNQIHVTVLLSLRLPLKQYCFHWIN